MELLDPNIENPANDSAINNSVIDYEGKCMFAAMEDPENSSIMAESMKIPTKPKGVTHHNKGLMLSWDVSSCTLQAIEFFEIQWKKIEEKRWSGRNCTDDNSTQMIIPITELNTNTAYQFKVRSVTTDGVESPFSDISDDIIIKTSQKPEKPIGSTSNYKDLLIKWEVPSPDLQAVDVFEIQWKTTEEKRWSGRKFTDDNSTNIIIPITCLEMNTVYQFKVRWITKDGEESLFSDISDDIIIRSWQKPEKPIGVTSNHKDLLISWNISSHDLQNVDVFEIQWKKTEEKRWSGRKCTEDNSTNITVPFTDLEINTAYQFKVRWITKEGTESQFSEISDDIITKTSQKPEKPERVTSNETDLLISWDVSSTDLQVVDFFEIQWKKSEEKRWSGRQRTDDNSTKITIPIKELEKNTAYQFKVRWTTQKGKESPFSDVSDDIIIKIFPKVQKPKGVISNDRDLLLSWDVPSSDLQVVDSFEIQWKKKEEKRWSGRICTSDKSTSIIISVSKLEKNTAYQFRVRWITTEGEESEFSDISDDIMIKMSQKPGQPKGVFINDQYLVISWDVSLLDLQAVDSFEIQWRKKDETRWAGRKHTNDNSTSITIPAIEFDTNTAYHFKVRWTTKEGADGEFSDVSDDIIFRMSQKPGQPKCVTIENKYLLISWDVTLYSLPVVDFFEIQWKKHGDKGWPGRRNTDDNSTSTKIPITEFEGNTVYQFKVRWIRKDGLESTFSEMSEDVIIAIAKKPDKPKEARRNNTELVICWDVSPSDLQAVDFFEIQWRKKEEKGWSGLKSTNDNSTSIAIPITNFEKNDTYQFKVKWTTKNGEESTFSEKSDDIQFTRNPQEPGKVVSLQTTATSACLLWEKPDEFDKVCYYEVKYRSCGEVQWLSVNTKDQTESLDLKDLKSKNNYEFKVRAVFSDGNEGPFSEVSDTVTTQISLAAKLMEKATKVSSANPQRYKIPLTFSEETTNKIAMTRKGIFGERNQLHPTKTIMVVGATGAGKSTLIDGMINYIVDVAWEDDFRFTMIDLTEDEKTKIHQQAKSQTSWITCYEVNYKHGSRLSYNLNIVDTPGFGDTRGIEQDKKIVDQIRDFFMAPGDRGIDTIDAVCFVTQAPLARLTHTQKYIFDAILSLFGKDIKDNIFVLITFADGKEPPVLAALMEANVPFKQTFNFNNSALFECTDSSKQFAQMFWKLGLASFENFFDELSKVQQKSLKLTSEVLQARKQIEITMEGLQPQIRDGLHKLNTMKKESEVLEKHKRDIAANKNFTYVVDEIHQRKIHTKPGQYVTNCFVCNFTCHPNCIYADDSDKAKCSAMGADGNCTVCTGHCNWIQHRNNDFYYETYVKQEQRTYNALKTKYDYAVTEEKKQTTVVEKIKSAFKLLGRNVMWMMKKVRESVNKLEQGALKPNPLNEVNYVKLLIESEQRDAITGWEARIQMLEGIKKKAELLEKIPHDGVEDSWTDEDVAAFLTNI
ncbi:hypothetical protein CHS0354_035639 [Potamilus streckersoni]|uniref:Fibronectin type-III domain-containing protein n=1 Tax=Potamilus streckersoni TaxID=2493646 RepID=A0AAE0WAU7_9BIVA|nr:hypothetical protein CHS0354_035639 [Potamilus streckersoni]